METNIRKAILRYEHQRKERGTLFMDQFSYIHHYDPELYDYFIDQLLDVVSMS